MDLVPSSLPLIFSIRSTLPSLLLSCVLAGVSSTNESGCPHLAACTRFETGDLSVDPRPLVNLGESVGDWCRVVIFLMF